MSGSEVCRRDRGHQQACSPAYRLSRHSANVHDLGASKWLIAGLQLALLADNGCKCICTSVLIAHVHLSYSDCVRMLAPNTPTTAGQRATALLQIAPCYAGRFVIIRGYLREIVAVITPVRAALVPASKATRALTPAEAACPRWIARNGLHPV